MRSKVYLIGAGICLAATLFAGCGGEYAGLMEGNAVSGPAVSGEAVSGDVLRTDAVSGGALKKQSSDIERKSGKNPYRFATDTNCYFGEYSGKAIISQYRLDMTQKKEIHLPHKNVDYFEAICVKDGYLYYRIALQKKGEDSSVSKIFRVPLGKDAEGYDVVKTEKKEEILTDTKGIQIASVYMDSRYICYLRGEWGERSELVKYDRKTKKVLPVEELPLNAKADKIVTGAGDWIVVMNMDKEICFQKMDETKWHKIEKKEFYRICYNGNAIFDTDRDENGRYTDIYKCNLKVGKWQSYVSIKELEKAARMAIGSDQTEQLECRVEGLSCQGDRLYIQVCVIWMEGGIYHVRNLFFYRGEGDDAVCYEKGLSECAHSHADVDAEQWENGIKEGREQIVLEDVSWIDVINRKVLLAFYNDEKEEGRVGCYELDTGDFRWLTKEDAEYYEPCYGTTEDWYFYRYLSLYEPASFSSFSNVILPEGVYVR